MPPDTFTNQLRAALDRRAQQFDFAHHRERMLRGVHRELPQLRLDILGPVLWVYWYSDLDPTEPEITALRQLAEAYQRGLLIRRMQNRGADPNTQRDWVYGEVPERWSGEENGLRYELRRSQGLSPGLFLDQRDNRHWVQAHAKDKRVLNLFAYTCGFSVAAAAGGASEVTSVDLSKTFLEWGRRNFQLNGLDASDPRYGFYASDSEKFLDGAAKRGRQFDLIICDPPSFSRDGKTVFRIERDLPRLLQKCYAVLAPGGLLITATNYEQWTAQQYKGVIQQALGPDIAHIEGPPSIPIDFEPPGVEPLMKSCYIWKRA